MNGRRIVDTHTVERNLRRRKTTGITGDDEIGGT